MPAALVATGALALGLAAGDFGDAPDKRATGYRAGAPIGRFPSLLASNGARSADIATAWLGPRVDTEGDARLVNRDRFDDGVAVRLKACRKSTAFVHVNVPPAGSRGTVFVNLLFDWNGDGTWGGLDRCAPEWAVRNFPIDLAAQGGAAKVYAISFPGGARNDELWYRTILSVEERLTEETGEGAFARGEVEDYFIGAKTKKTKKKRRPRSFGARCVPNPLVITHAQSGVIFIVPAIGSAPITEVRLPNSVIPRTPAREITAVGFSVRYTSTKVDPPRRVEQLIVPVRVRFGRVASIVLKCVVWVVHDAPIVVALPPPGTWTPTGPTSEWAPQPFQTPTFVGTYVGIRLDLGSTEEWRRQGLSGDLMIYGVELLFPQVVLGLMWLGDPQDPGTPRQQCGLTKEAAVCQSEMPLPMTTHFAIVSREMSPIPDEKMQLAIIALDKQGKRVATIVSKRKTLH